MGPRLRRIEFSLFLAIALAAPLAACDSGATTSEAATAQGGLPDGDPALAKQLVADGALLLDVRTDLEFLTGSIDGAKNIPHGDISARVADILESQGGDKHRPIVVFCRSGMRAASAKSALVDAGFDRVTNLGGKSDWPGD